MPATIQKILKPTKYRAVDTSTSLQPTINVINDGGFSVDVAESTTGTFWITGDDCVISSNSATWTNDSGNSSGNCTQTNLAHPLENGATYRVTFTLSGFNQHGGSGGFRIKLHADAGNSAIGTTRKANGTYVEDLTITSSSSSASNQVIIQSYQDPMSGSISNISVEKLESFGNNNHGQIYSGRALEFDGAVDYLTGPTVAEGFTDLSYTKNFTVACWLKIDSLEDAGVWAMGQSTDDRVGLTIGADGEIAFTAWDSSSYTHASGGAEGSKAIEANTWYRVICTMSPTNTKKLYINGVLQTGTSQTFGSPLSSISTQLYIGRTGLSATGYLGMKMSDFQVWNSTWTQSDVTYDYLNPESLALSNGGTSLTESNLKLWYPMQDGHRGQQSYIMDGANTGLGSEEIVTGWNNNDFTSLSSTGTNITSAVSNGSANHELYSNAINMTSGDAFKVTFTLGGTTGSALRFYLSTNTHLGSADYVTDTLSTGTYTFYINSNTTDSTMYFGFRSTYQVCDFSVSNFSVKRVNHKHHATTVFLGEELITNGTFEVDDNWANFGSPGDNVRSSDQAHSGTYSRKFGVNDEYEGIESEPFTVVAGRTYYLSCEVYPDNTTTIDIRMIQGDGSTTLTQNFTGLTQDAWNTITTTFRCTQSGNGAHIVFSSPTGQTSGNWFIDDVTFKEQGVATGWTDADQQLDIPQTALQSYNQLAWFDGHNAVCKIDDNDVYSFGVAPSATANDSAFSISAWINMNEATTFPIVEKFKASHREYRFACGSDDKLALILYDEDNSGGWIRARTSSTITAHENEWIHVVATYSGNESNSGITLYLNGESLDLTTDNSGTYAGMRNQTGEVWIGASENGGNYANGCITETSIWNKELSQAEINELYNDGNALDATIHSGTSNLVSYWRNNGLAEWKDLKNPDVTTFDGTPTNMTETILFPAGVDTSRDTQGFLMNKQKTTNSLNLKTSEGLTVVSDNSPDAVIIQDSESFDHSDGSNSKLSISAWFKANSYGSLPQDQVIVSKGTSNGGKREWKLLLDDSSTTQLLLMASSEGNGGNGNDLTYDLGNITDTNWHHIVVTYDGTAIAGNEVVAYLDGGSAIEVSHANAEAKINAEDGNVCIGDILFTNTGGDGFEFDGQIDDVCYYNRKILSATEAKRNYNAGKRSHK